MAMVETGINTAPRPKLLIVDDDHELCSMLAEYLGPEGFLTEAVGSGPAALDRLGREPVDLVVLDVMLPELSGFEVLRRIRALNRDRKSTRLNSSHANISYAVFCLKKKKRQNYN